MRAAVVLTLWLAGGCVTVPAGMAGVVLPPRGGVRTEPLGEGVHVLPLCSVNLYDLRAQERDQDLRALTADGSPLLARASLVTYHVPAAELAALDREIGPDYYRVLVSPTVLSMARRVLGRLPANAFGSDGIRRAQQEIASLAAAALRPRHVVLDGVQLRGVFVLSAIAYRTMLETTELEQQALATPQRLQLARQRAEALRERGRGQALSFALLAPTLAPEALAEAEGRAWDLLLRAPSTAVAVRATDQPTVVEVTP